MPGSSFSAGRRDRGALRIPRIIATHAWSPSRVGDRWRPWLMLDGQTRLLALHGVHGFDDVLGATAPSHAQPRHGVGFADAADGNGCSAKTGRSVAKHVAFAVAVD